MVVVTAFVTAAILIAAFVIWEIRTAHPLLDVKVFVDMRFTAASVAVATAFFALFGFIFLITQYLQLVLGYSPLEAGVRTVPFAAATAVMSPIAIMLMHRVGTKVVVTIGLLLMGAGFALAATCDASSSYVGPILGSMLLGGAGGRSGGMGDEMDAAPRRASAPSAPRKAAAPATGGDDFNDFPGALADDDDDLPF
jgi:hypothetical protein